MSIAQHSDLSKHIIKTVPVKCPVCGLDVFRETATGYDFEYDTSADTYQFVCCLECNVLYLNPRPDISELEKIYPVEYAPYSFEAGSSLTLRIRSILEHKRILYFRKLFKAEGDIIDGGCGGITFLESLRRFGGPGWRLWGNDISPQVCEHLCRKGFFAIQGRFEDIDMPSGSFDGIILKQVFEHLELPQAVLRKSYQLLRDGGLLIIETPNFDAWDAKIFKKHYWGGYHFPRHLTIFDEEILRKVACNAGFVFLWREYMLSPSFWAQSVHHLLKDKGAPVWVYKLFTHKNPLVMSFAVLMDCIQMFFTGKTSNFQIVFRKP